MLYDKEIGHEIIRGSIDVICGGDPCQANSNARRHGKVPETPAGHFLRIVKEVYPRYVLRENPASVRKDAPWPWWRFAGHLEGMGYLVLPFKIRSCCVGGNYRGERLYLFAALPSANGAGLERYVREVLERADEGGQDAHFTGPVGGGVPHPEFVESLMGYQTGWTDLNL